MDSTLIRTEGATLLGGFENHLGDHCLGEPPAEWKDTGDVTRQRVYPGLERDAFPGIPLSLVE